MASPSRILLIINPISGNGQKKGLADKIARALAMPNVSVDVAYTEHSGHATELATNAVSDKYAVVIACGGDGTINETAKALCDTNTALAIIPSGSGNGLARHLGIPMNLDDAIEVIRHQHVEKCDYGTVNGKHFFCTFGIGFDAAVSDRFAASKSRGLATYARSAVAELLTYKPAEYKIEADGRTITTPAFIITGANASQYGNNAYIAPQASVQDGLIDIVIAPSVPMYSLPGFGFDMMCGTLPHNRNIKIIKCKHAVIKRDSNGPGHVDGEPADLGATLEIECHHSALKIIVPQHKQPLLPVLSPLTDIVVAMENSIKTLFHRK